MDNTFHPSTHTQHPLLLRAIVAITGTALYVLSLASLLFWSHIANFFFVPWDDVPMPVPPPDGWQRVLNAFFSVPPGQYALFALVGVASLALFTVRMRRGRDRWLVPAELGLLNTALMFGSGVLMLAATALMRQIMIKLTGDVYVAGYAVNAPAIILLLVSLALWVWAQDVGVITQPLRAYPVATLAATLLCDGLLLWFFGPLIQRALHQLP